MARLSRSERLLRARLASAVRRLREKRGLSLWDAGERASIHWRHWQKIEAGEANVTLQTLARMAEALGVAPRDLL